GVVDAARGEHVAAHQHQPAVGAGVAVPVPGGTGDATVDPAVVTQPSGLGQRRGVSAVGVAGADPPAEPAGGWYRLGHVDVGAVAARVALQGGIERATLAEVDRNPEVEAAVGGRVEVLVDAEVECPVAPETAVPVGAGVPA